MSKNLGRDGAPGHRKLALCHRIAVNAYMSGMTKTDAMAEAGYASGTTPANVFDRGDVRHEIERLTEKLMAKYEVDREWVMRQLVDIATAGETLAKFKKITPDGLLDWNFAGATQAELALIDTLSIEKHVERDGAVITKFKIGLPSRQAALESLCRILGLNKDKLDLGVELTLVERLQRGRDRARIEGGEVEVLADED